MLDITNSQEATQYVPLNFWPVENRVKTARQWLAQSVKAGQDPLMTVHFYEKKTAGHIDRQSGQPKKESK
jgi:hypothetical protein